MKRRERSPRSARDSIWSRSCLWHVGLWQWEHSEGFFRTLKTVSSNNLVNLLFKASSVLCLAGPSFAAQSPTRSVLFASCVDFRHVAMLMVHSSTIQC